MFEPILALKSSAENGRLETTRATGMAFEKSFVTTMTPRASANAANRVQVDDASWVILKTTPVTTTATGVVTVDSTNPNRPVFTSSQGINAGKTWVIKFTATVGATVTTVTTGSYCNVVSPDFESKTLSGSPEACVSVVGGSIGDTVYRDWNGNGTQSGAGEVGAVGVVVSLYNDVNSNGSFDPGTDTVVSTTITGVNGAHLFDNLPPGNFTVVGEEGTVSYIWVEQETTGRQLEHGSFDIVLAPPARETSVRLVPMALEMQFTGEPGTEHLIETTDDMVAGRWTAAGQFKSDPSGVILFHQPLDGTEPVRFCRALLP